MPNSNRRVPYLLQFESGITSTFSIFLTDFQQLEWFSINGELIFPHLTDIHVVITIELKIFSPEVVVTSLTGITYVANFTTQCV